MNNAFVCKCTLGGKSSFYPFISARSCQNIIAWDVIAHCRTLEYISVVCKIITTTINKWDCNVWCIYEEKIKSNRYAAHCTVHSALLIKWFGFVLYSRISYGCKFRRTGKINCDLCWFQWKEAFNIAKSQKNRPSFVRCVWSFWIVVFVTVQFSSVFTVSYKTTHSYHCQHEMSSIARAAFSCCLHLLFKK